MRARRKSSHLPLRGPHSGSTFATLRNPPEATCHISMLFGLYPANISVHILPMSDFEDRYLAAPVINKIDDSVTSLSHPVTVGVPGELFGPLGPGGRGQGLHSMNDTLTIGLGAYCVKLLRGGGLDQQPIFGHAFSSLGRTYRRKGSSRSFSRRTSQDPRHPRPRRPSPRR